MQDMGNSPVDFVVRPALHPCQKLQHQGVVEQPPQSADALNRQAFSAVFGVKREPRQIA